MLHIEKYGAIDIGSNAIRLLVATVVEEEGKNTLFKKTSLVRVPIRLGADVFLEGKISEVNTRRMIDAMNAFRLLMNTHNVKRFKACATSAMREATNGQEIADRIKKEAGVFINIIDGNDEAAIIASTDLKSLIQNDKVFLYVDVGGGSTEFTIFAEGQTVASKSFKLGTVRLLNDMVEDTMWQQVEEWIRSNTKPYKKISVIGSGGNINSIYKNSGKKIGKPLSYFYLASFYDLIRSYTLDERITQMDMNPDRADVIVPATRIYLSAMKWAGAKNIFVPKIGLSDGIIKSLYNEKIAESLEVNQD
ncbi:MULTISPECIES: ethanolamine ammonia-lyase reactivating factor EutA [Altibacter]|uniref:Ppx/GppA phosphatase family protein n=1 Tax=Altibacter TaxID=1535231 RepID=UPI00054DF604|nr:MULTISPECIES: ethanolamine ammonia-lyase reactivating factor EutA [Altibacter]MCW8981372.1 ethanolamine ammonia-lyase reactivating factor EutA [Altibacter sp.]MCW9036566.1 ethanolamine ammonia-lyase reactivating factor EutA [Altibacter sp.]